MLARHLWALRWTTMTLEIIDEPLAEKEFVSRICSHVRDTADQKKQHFESCSEEAAHTAVRTLIDLGVLVEKCERGGIVLAVSPLFTSSENRKKLQRFVSQYLYN